MGGTYTGVLETKSNGQWAPSAPIVMRADEGDSPRDVGLDWVADRLPSGDDWRLRVWSGERVDLDEPPAATLRPTDLASVTSGPRIPAPRAGSRRQPVRVTGPASEVAQRVRVDQVEPGTAILVTDDRRNSAASEGDGPWWPAADTSRAVRAVVRQSLVNRGGPLDGYVDLITSVGEVRRVLGHRSVALA